jgi:hypothetical protein
MLAPCLHAVLAHGAAVCKPPSSYPDLLRFAGLPATLLRCLQPGVFGMSAQDQQAQLRQLLNQAQQRVPGMP